MFTSTTSCLDPVLSSIRARNALTQTVTNCDVTTWSWVNLVNLALAQLPVACSTLTVSAYQSSKQVVVCRLQASCLLYGWQQNGQQVADKCVVTNALLLYSKTFRPMGSTLFRNPRALRNARVATASGPPVSKSRRSLGLQVSCNRLLILYSHTELQVTLTLLIVKCALTNWLAAQHIQSTNNYRVSC